MVYRRFPDRYIDITLTFGERSIHINKTSVFRLISVYGLESSDYSVNIENYSMLPGGYITGRHMLPRPIDLTFAISSKDQEFYRREVIKTLNPNKDGVLSVTRSGVTRWIPVIINGLIDWEQENIITSKPQIKVSFICDDPYFRGETKKFNFSFVEPLFSFPLNMMGVSGTTSGMVQAEDSFTIDNDGDLPIGVLVDIKATGGAVTNPAILCDGQALYTVYNMAYGDKMEISTETGNKYVKVNGVKKPVFTRTSVFFSIEPGLHTIRLSAEAYVTNASASITYTLKYLGV